MMNVTLELSDEELVEVAQLLARLRKDAAVLASMPTLTDEERQVAASKPIEAMRAVRTRLGCSLKAAKDLVDATRGRT